MSQMKRIKPQTKSFSQPLFTPFRDTRSFAFSLLVFREILHLKSVHIVTFRYTLKTIQRPAPKVNENRYGDLRRRSRGVCAGARAHPAVPTIPQRMPVSLRVRLTARSRGVRRSPRCGRRFPRHLRSGWTRSRRAPRRSPCRWEARGRPRSAWW